MGHNKTHIATTHRSARNIDHKCTYHNNTQNIAITYIITSAYIRTNIEHTHIEHNKHRTSQTIDHNKHKTEQRIEHTRMEHNKYRTARNLYHNET